MVLEAGTRLGAYEIVSRAGSGGMGVVYKARDPRLDRLVAIKVLPPDLTRDALAKQRFVLEAKSASALDHPNICTIHEINETADGQLYLVMAYYHGETLTQKIASGPLVLEEALDVAIQAGQGLAKAHAAGIVHRDIKPANLIVTPSRDVKILDFGLAKLAGSDGVTQTGTTLGTVAYMSPEQARGEDVDHRSDIWSLGVVLYEMLAGMPPFGGDNLLSISHAILEREPPPLPESARRAQGVVSRALRKGREHRQQSVTELLTELRTVQGAAASGVITRRQPDAPFIAVLPFTNMSPDPENEYFSDGLTEEIIADLSQIRALRVISRTSIMRLKGTDKDLKTIGRELNARYLLEGSVRKAGHSLRITAQLIDAADDVHVWADKYSGSLEDVFDIQERVSRAIVKALHVTLSPDEDRRVAERPIQDVRAYECYLRARQEIYRLTETSLNHAEQFLRQGLELIGENELLHAALGDTLFQRYNVGIRLEEGCLREAEQHAARALDLNPRTSHGRVLKGLIAYKRADLRSAVQSLKQALDSDPDNVAALFWLTYLYAHAGRCSAARPLASRLLELDPLTPFNHGVAGLVEVMDGKFAEALPYYQRWYEMDPDHPFTHWVYAGVLVLHDRKGQADVLLDALPLSTPRTLWDALGIALRSGLRNEPEAVQEAVTPAVKAAIASNEQFSWHAARFFALAGLTQDALDSLQNAIRLGFINYPFLSRYDPLLENIRREKRFTDLMEQVRSQWERFEV